jgi:hypothetical protein
MRDSKDRTIRTRKYINPPIKANISSLEYGLKYEKIARELYNKNNNCNVVVEGFKIDIDFPFIGGSPDGIEKNKNFIIEIKCPETAEKYQTIDKWFEDKKCNFLERIYKEKEKIYLY